jgi:hypothetical protein
MARVRSFYGRGKILLGDLRAVRNEMCRCYRAAVAKELSWGDYKAATLGLTRLATLDQGELLDRRVAELESRLARAGNGYDSSSQLYDPELPL